MYLAKLYPPVSNWMSPLWPPSLNSLILSLNISIARAISYDVCSRWAIKETPSRSFSKSNLKFCHGTIFCPIISSNDFWTAYNEYNDIVTNMYFSLRDPLSKSLTGNMTTYLHWMVWHNILLFKHIPTVAWLYHLAIEDSSIDITK